LSSKDFEIAQKKVCEKPAQLQAAFDSGFKKTYDELILILKRKKTKPVAVKKAVTFLQETAKQPLDSYPPENQVYAYVCQHHFRGRSCHTDLRIEFEKRKRLIGWTIDDLRKGVIKKPILTVKDAREVPLEAFKIKWWGPEKGEWLPRKKRGAKKLVTTSLLAQPKGLHSFVWLTIPDGVTRGVGATKKYPGVFIKRDHGIVEYGTQKHWFHEYFFNGEVFKYRVLFRQFRFPLKKSDILYLADELDCDEEEIIKELLETVKDKELVLPPSEPAESQRESWGWLAIKPIDQTPYVISDRAVETRFIPPYGISALPSKIRKEIPTEFRYWKKKNPKERIKIRDELVKAEVIKLEGETGKFVLSRQIYRGPKQVRIGPTQIDYHLWIIKKKGIDHFVLDMNPFEHEASGMIERKGKDDYDTEGWVKPGSSLNPTKETPSLIKILDKGKVVIYIDKMDVKKWHFEGKTYKGFLLAEKELDSDVWQVWREHSLKISFASMLC